MTKQRYMADGRVSDARLAEMVEQVVPCDSRLIYVELQEWRSGRRIPVWGEQRGTVEPGEAPKCDKCQTPLWNLYEHWAFACMCHVVVNAPVEPACEHEPGDVISGRLDSGGEHYVYRCRHCGQQYDKHIAPV